MVSDCAVKIVAMHLPSQDHRIGNICTLELIETKHTTGLGDICRNHRQRIEVIPVLHFHNMHALMYILHEVVEMDSGLFLDVQWQRIEEQVHQHGFATANIAIHVHAFRQVLGDRRLDGLFRAEERAEESRLWLGI
jgi:hypothetical protein